MPGVPITITKRAEALAISFSLVNPGRQTGKRNAELCGSVIALRATAAMTPDLRFEHREVWFASGNCSKLSIGRNGATAPHAAILIPADLPDTVDVVNLVKTIRDTIQGTPLQGQTKFIDGGVGLYVKNTTKHRREMLD